MVWNTNTGRNLCDRPFGRTFCMFKQADCWWDGDVVDLWIRFHGSLSKAPCVATGTHQIKGLLAIMQNGALLGKRDAWAVKGEGNTSYSPWSHHPPKWGRGVSSPPCLSRRRWRMKIEKEHSAGRLPALAIMRWGYLLCGSVCACVLY